MLPISPLAQPTAASSRLMPPPPTNTDFYAMVQERTLFTKLLLVKQGQCQLQLPIIEAKKSLQASSSIRCACRLLLYIYIKNSDSYPFYIFHQQFNHQFPSFPLKSNHSPLFWRGAGGEASWGCGFLGVRLFY